MTGKNNQLAYIITNWYVITEEDTRIKLEKEKGKMDTKH